jgi:hypothetical protein
MLIGSFFLQRVRRLVCSPSWAPNRTLPAYKEHLNYLVISFQRNRVSPYRSSKEVGSRKVDNGDVGSGNERKRRPPCNGTDRGCVAWPGQHHLAGNGADFPLVLERETMGGTDEGSKANDDGATRWCSFPYCAGFFRRSVSRPQVSIA